MIVTRALPFALLLASALPLSVQADGAFEVSGPKGGTASGSWSCGWLGEAWVCNGNATVTTEDGRVGTRERTTSLSDTTGSTVVTGTRVNGHEFTRSRTWTR